MGMTQTPHETVENLDRRIERYKPHTAWESANQRYLKYLKRIRTKIEKNIKVKENAQKRQERRKRRNNEPGIERIGEIERDSNAFSEDS